MESAYSVAVSKLETVMGKGLQIKLYADMTSDQKKRSLAGISIGRGVLEGVLKTPTRAVARFNQGADLLQDWDTINLKISAKPRARDLDLEVEQDAEDLGSRSSRSSASSRSRDEDTDSNSSPAKKPK